MHYHIHEDNRKFSNTQNHFVGLLEPWEFRSILSWITYNWEFIFKSHTNSDLQIWYKLMYDSWCKMCFFNFNSYFFTSLLFFSNFDIKSFKDSHTIHFAKTDTFFHTSILKRCFFFNLFIVDWKIPPMLNSLLIYKNVIKIMKTINFIPNNKWQYLKLTIKPWHLHYFWKAK
jgi:hypothetical protein